MAKANASTLEAHASVMRNEIVMMEADLAKLSAISSRYQGLLPSKEEASAVHAAALQTRGSTRTGSSASTPRGMADSGACKKPAPLLLNAVEFLSNLHQAKCLELNNVVTQQVAISDAVNKASALAEELKSSSFYSGPGGGAVHRAHATGPQGGGVAISPSALGPGSFRAPHPANPPPPAPPVGGVPFTSSYSFMGSVPRPIVEQATSPTQQQQQYASQSSTASSPHHQPGPASSAAQPVGQIGFDPPLAIGGWRSYLGGGGSADGSPTQQPLHHLPPGGVPLPAGSFVGSSPQHQQRGFESSYASTSSMLNGTARSMTVVLPSTAVTNLNPGVAGH